MDKPHTPSSLLHWHLPQALAAWLLPGLGHWLLGERARGLVVGLTILSLWVGGLLIGGFSVIDRRDNFPWFLGQMLLAPSLASDAYLQGRLKIGGSAPIPGPVARYEPSFGHANEQGTLYTALAGLLNLLAIMDVAYHDPGRRGRRQTGSVDQTPGAQRQEART